MWTALMRTDLVGAGRKRAVPFAVCRFVRTLAVTAARMSTACLTLAAVLTLTSVASAADTLATLIQTGDRDAALELIDTGTDVNASQGDGTTPLHWAVYRIDVDLSRTLLDHGAEPDAFNRYGSTPLAEAVKIASLDLVEMLVDAGADVESPNEDRQTVLMLAARSGSVEIAELLLRQGADVNARETWRSQTALMWATDSNFPAMSKLLIDHGADVEARARANDWPAQLTTEPRNQYRPTGGLTPLLYAARAGCRDCAAALLEAGADPDRPNPDGVTPLIIAMDNFAYDTARVLFEHGANPHLWDWWGRTALYAAVDMNTYNLEHYGERTGPPIATEETTPLELARMFLDAGVNPSHQLNMHRPERGGHNGRFSDEIITTGATPVLRAAASQDYEALRLLVDYGGRVDVPNVMGVTPLMAAAGLGMEPSQRFNPDGNAEDRAIATMEILLAAGADVNARITDVTGRTARIGRSSTLIERRGQTALFGAVQWAWPRAAQYLIDHGAEVDIVDDKGASPLDIALGRAGSRDDRPSEEVAAVLERALNGGG